MVSRWLMSNLESQYPQRPLAEINNHDAIIVLGGGLRIPLPPAQRTQLGSTSDRYWYATQLFKAGKAPTIIVSGGNVYRQANFKGEASYAAELLVKWGVPEDVILYEDNSRNTLQNRQLAASLLSREGAKSALLVTSASHMPRAVKIFSELPINVVPASADVAVRQVDRPAVFNWLPSAGAMQQTTRALHEYYGMAVLYMSSRLNALMDKG